MGVTIADIAKRLDLSPSTVSRSLAQSTRVPPATRVRVARVAAELGYQGRIRRQKPKGRDGAGDAFQIAVVLQGLAFQSSINAIKLLEGLTAERDGSNAALHIGLAPEQRPEAPETPEARAGKVNLPPICTEGNPCDLAILMGRHDPAMVAELVRRCPVVSATTRYPGIEHDHADTADYWGLYNLTTRALEMGHRRLAWISESNWNTGSFAGVRRAGFTQACLEHGVDLANVQWAGPEAFDNDGTILAERLQPMLEAGTTCFVCVTDRVAFEVLARLRQWSVDVPGTVSVTGFDAVQAYMPSNPPTLTSVDPLWIEIGRAAMSLAMRRLTQPSAPQMTLTVGCRFVEGETLGPPGA